MKGHAPETPTSSGTGRASKESEAGPNAILAGLNDLLPDLEALYKDIHSNPELSMQEMRTAGIVAERLRAAGYEVTTGVGNAAHTDQCLRRASIR